MPVLHSEKDFLPSALKHAVILLLLVLHICQTFAYAADELLSLSLQTSLQKSLLAELLLY